MMICTQYPDLVMLLDWTAEIELQVAGTIIAPTGAVLLAGG
ncbi:MAG: hypothetical protein ACI83P_001568 [Janthinobacterium sp.]|jgi:hypothetical protein